MTVSTFSSQLWQLTQAKQLTGKEHLVLQALASFEGDKGLFPSHESIAIKAGCSCATVIRTLKKAYELGIVKRTLRRTISSSGRIVRSSNTYTLHLKDLADCVALAKQHAQKLRDALERRKAQFLNRFSKLQNASGPNSKSYNLEEKRSHSSVQDYLALISEWDREHKSRLRAQNCS